MTRYADKTSVSSERSRGEIERTLCRYGATGFAYAWDQQKAAVTFIHEERKVRFVLVLPDRDDRRFTHTPSRGTPRSSSQTAAAYEQAVRQRWRALSLVIKAKLEAVEAGIASFDEEFLAYLCLPDGRTVADHVLPEVADAYDGCPPLTRMLPDFGRKAIEGEVLGD